MAVVAAVNFRGVGESVKANVVLTCVELTGLLIIIVIGLWAIGAGQGDVSRVTQFKTVDGSAFWPVIAATTLAFFAMVGFEDSVNMAEECKNPTRIFPKVLLAGPAHHRRDLCPGVDLGDHARLARAARRRRDAAPEGRAGRRSELPGGDLRLHHDVRRGQQRADQHADGEPAGLRHEQRARPPGRARQGPPRRGARPISRSASRRCSPLA